MTAAIQGGRKKVIIDLVARRINAEKDHSDASETMRQTSRNASGLERKQQIPPGA